MANVARVSPEEAAELLGNGYIYVDVRTPAEFEQGHPPGALNVPLMQSGPSGMTPNPEFLSVVQAAFGTGEHLVIGCRSGARSKRAAEMMSAAGYEHLADLAAGFEGSKDNFGRPIPGWSKANLPVETGLPEGQRYEDVKQRTPK